MVCDACTFCDDVCGCGECREKVRKQGRSEFTKCQVKRHASAESCWLIAHSEVYDATSFIPLHPAGMWPILQRAGKDCTVDYDFHSRWSQDERRPSIKYACLFRMEAIKDRQVDPVLLRAGQRSVCTLHDFIVQLGHIFSNLAQLGVSFPHWKFLAIWR